MTRAVVDLAALIESALRGERRSIGRLLSIAERGGPEADELTDAVHDRSGTAHIVGVTGPPGSGKSTLVGRLTAVAGLAGARPAVLAVDPSSPLTGGAILGDRLRIDGGTPDVFVRSIANRGHHGGLALAVPGAVRVLDAAGFDPILIETVGVGQVEIDVAAVADTTIVVANPGTGDSVQASKAGLLEVADIFVVNKSDQPGADEVRRDLGHMLDLSRLTGQELRRGRRPPIVMTDSLTGSGAAELWDEIGLHRDHLVGSATLAERRARRALAEVRAILDERLARRLDALIGSAASEELFEGPLTPPQMAARLERRLGGDL